MSITGKRPFFIPSLLCHSGSFNPSHGLLLLLLCLLLFINTADVLIWDLLHLYFKDRGSVLFTLPASTLFFCSFSEHLASTHWVTCIRSPLAPRAGPLVQIRRRCSLEPASRWKGQEVPPAPEAAALMHRDELKLSPTRGLFGRHLDQGTPCTTAQGSPDSHCAGHCGEVAQKMQVKSSRSREEHPEDGLQAALAN